MSHLFFMAVKKCQNFNIERIIVDSGGFLLNLKTD